MADWVVQTIDMRLAGVLVLAAGCLVAGPMTPRERQRLVAHLEMTESWLVDEVANLTPAQLEFRAEPGAWSVKDNVEHLAVAEAQYWQELQDSMKQPLVTEKTDVTDDAILWYGIDRSRKARTGEAREPKGQFDTAAKALAAWRNLRATMLTYANSTEEDLRGHRYKESKTDVYQWFTMISSHAQRHILQVRELKHQSNFPRK